MDPWARLALMEKKNLFSLPAIEPRRLGRPASNLVAIPTDKRAKGQI
jgi:hypothetical protein